MMVKFLMTKGFKKQNQVYVIETIKGSNYGYRYSDKLKGLYLKRISANSFPAHYGRIELLDPEGYRINSSNSVKNKDDDVFIISDRNLHPNIMIPEELTIDLGSFKCIDSRTNETDNKKIIGLKGEIDTYPLYRLNTDLDSIRSFLITLRGSFKVTGFIPGNGLPDKLKQLYELIDWNLQSYWPLELGFNLEDNYHHNQEK